MMNKNNSLSILNKTERAKYYNKFGWGYAVYDNSFDLREIAFKKLDYPIEAKYDKHFLLRKKYYERHGADITAKYDEHVNIRALYYIDNGYDEQARHDCSWIRMKYYEKYGYTEDSFNCDVFDYFKKCREILGYGNGFIKTKFTEDEAELLRFNGINVHKESIILT